MIHGFQAGVHEWHLPCFTLINYKSEETLIGKKYWFLLGSYEHTVKGGTKEGQKGSHQKGHIDVALVTKRFLTAKNISDSK